MSGIVTPKDGRNPLNVLQDDIALALMAGPKEGEPIPIVETTRDVINYYNRANLAGFDQSKYFIMQNVIVCESGNRDLIKSKLSRDLDNLKQVTGGPSNPKPAA